MWGGSFVVTINTKLLGGKISFFQCVCVLGYCIFPIVLGAAIMGLLKIFGVNIFILRLVIAIVCLIWAGLSKILIDEGSISFMNVIIDPKKNIIAIYPIFLFYLFIDWFLIFI